MKFAQWAVLGVAAMAIGGCAGFKAYVPAGGGTGTGGGGNTSPYCDLLQVSGPSIVSMGSTDSSREFLSFSYEFSEDEIEQFLNLSVTGAPAGMTFSFPTNPLEVRNDDGYGTQFTITTNSVPEGNYELTVQIQRAGCVENETYRFDVSVVDFGA